MGPAIALVVILVFLQLMIEFWMRLQVLIAQQGASDWYHEVKVTSLAGVGLAQEVECVDL